MTTGGGIKTGTVERICEVARTGDRDIFNYLSRGVALLKLRQAFRTLVLRLNYIRRDGLSQRVFRLFFGRSLIIM